MPVTVEKLETMCKNREDCEMLQPSLFRSNKPLIQEMTEHLNGQDNAIDTIPATAVKIKVMNVQNPYIMRIYEIKKYEETLNNIQRKLSSFMKTDRFLKGENNSKDPKLGDVVLVQNSNHETEIELPSFICRGLITYVKKEEKIYYILLVDYGTSIELTRDKFYIVPQDFISEKYLTKTVGVYNILPVRMRKNVPNRVNGSNDSNSSTAVVVEEWSEGAIHFAKDLLYASQLVYFDHVVTDEKNGREYGEFYFVIDNIIMPLSEALVINYHAIYIEGDLLQLIENENHIQQKEDLSEHIICIKFSTKKNRSITYNVEEINDSLKKFCLSEKVLIQSTVNCGIINDVSDLRYPTRIHKGWNECIQSSRPRKIQSYMWPAINNGLNVVAVGASQCGKTSGCVMAVCGLVAMLQNESSYHATRPLALILCSSSSEVAHVQFLCTSFLTPFSNIKSVAALNNILERKIVAAIYNGCHILVATPRYLVRFLKSNKNLLSFDRLSYLVIDNADVILDKYYNTVGELFKKHKIIENREPQGDNRPLLQIIISATNWTPQIKKFVPLVMYNPYICITSFLEAIVFKSVCPTLYILKSTSKNQKISDLLKDDYTTLKTMIICINAEEAEELNTFLLLTKKTLLIHERMKPSDIRALRENWKACVHGFYPVLICTDIILSELNFTNIQWLIHHSVLLKFKHQFNYRFSVLLDHLTQDTVSCKVSIITDEKNDVQLLSIMRLMLRMNVKISPELAENIERIAITLERDKKNYAICNNVKSFGFCQEQNVCVYRHCVLPKIDAPLTDVQINDNVKLMLICIHDTTHLSARIIEHIPHSDESKKIIFSNVEYMRNELKLQEHYRNIENRKVCISTNVGDICVLEEAIDKFKRVQIMRIRSDRDCSEDAKFVDVRCIDSGLIYECIDVRKLMHIPEELLNLPTHIIEVFLAGLAPHDEEYTWNYATNEAVHEWLSENGFNNPNDFNFNSSYIIGKVRLHIGNTMWLDDFQIRTKLISYADLMGSSLKKKLLDENFAVLNDDHVPNLFKLCKNSGLTEVNGHDINVVCK